MKKARNSNAGAYLLVFWAALAVLFGARDFFTEEEIQKLRDNQEIHKRAETFLKIAHGRLDEIERRTGLSLEAAPEPNPLEFYRLAELMIAYNSAYDSLMNNLDDRFKIKKDDPKHIKKAFKLTFEKTQELMPRLKKIQQKSIEKRDKELYEQALKALDNSEAALKGSKAFLAAFDSPKQK